MKRKAVQQIKINYTDFFKYTYISFNTIYDLNYYILILYYVRNMYLFYTNIKFL